MRIQELTLLHVRDGRTWSELTVSDLGREEGARALRIEPDRTWLAAVTKTGERAHLSDCEWDLSEHTWVGDQLTYLLYPDRYCALGYVSSPDGRGVPRFYLNGQLPFWISGGAVCTLDLEVDAVADAEFARAAWKDLDRFKKAVVGGAIDLVTARNTIRDVHWGIRMLRSSTLRQRLVELSMA
ncbi:hypothetical protein ACPPVW_01645 [Leifsonia sp. McL0607]|uniref:hypothetical protein n=1 Tax=Leifsonia sp. McL0607 TaxID=3415672 RepID=UPI003CEDE8A0